MIDRWHEQAFAAEERWIEQDKKIAIKQAFRENDPDRVVQVFQRDVIIRRGVGR